jgi:exonuclease SbcD
MRILHFADLHLGVENYGRPDAATGLHTRLLDFLRSFDFIVDAAITRQVDLALFCGDAFRSREPLTNLQCLFAERIRRLVEADIPVLILAGNHDQPPLPGKHSALEIYPILSVPGVVVALTPGLRRIETRSGPVQVACLPAAAGSSEFRVQSSESGKAEDRNGVLQLIDKMASQLTPDCPAILAAHVMVKGAYVSSGAYLNPKSEITLPREALARPEFAYVALGHVHTFQDLNPNGAPPLVYCGSPERVDFGEEKEDKGFVIAEIGEVESSQLASRSLGEGRFSVPSPNNKFIASYEFMQTPARKFITVDVQLEPGSGTTQVLEAIAEQEIEDSVVKLVLHSSEEMAVDVREIQRALGGAAFATPVSREVENPPARLRAPDLAQHWGNPLAALEEYLHTTRYSEERKAQLRTAAKHLLDERAST